MSSSTKSAASPPETAAADLPEANGVPEEELPPRPPESEPELPSLPETPQYVIPITPIIPVPPYSLNEIAAPAVNFDHNDLQYHCCCNSMHITVAARVVSLTYLCAAVIKLIFSISLQNTTLAFYSIATFTFALAIFGTLIYGVFKEKRPFILPYMIFQVASIICTVFIAFTFVVGGIFSDKIIHSLAADIAGIQINENMDVQSEVQIFSILFLIGLVLVLFIQIWFLDIIYRFSEFIKDRESSFSLNLETVLNSNDGIFNHFSSTSDEKLK